MLIRQPNCAFILAMLCLTGAAAAQIDYKITPDTDKKVLKVEMDFRSKSDSTQIQIPNWAPGAYVLGEQYKNVADLAATTGGKPIQVAADKNTWTLSAPSGSLIHVSYSVPLQFADQTAHWSGPATYLYVVDRKNEPCTLKLALPEGWKVATGLDESKGGTFVAPTYDVLADCPVTAGDFILDSYTVKGKPHIIAMRNPPKSKVDRAYLIKACKFVSEAEADFFGGVPYNHYVWHFSVNDAADGAGGLEHLNSTQISLASGVGPRAVSVLAHEFFHLWNVKRTRSKVLGPFDYTVLPKTGALWWLEGVTDYYANLLLTRYGWWQPDSLYGYFVRELRNVRQNPARLEISPYQASYRVGEANNGRGNSNGYLISYYDLGSLCGLCLDIEIRFQSGGKNSLDDVTRALFAMCKDNQPGFEEDEIRKQCVKFGGPELGPFFDKVVMNPGELPIEAQLEKVGLKLEDAQEDFVDLGFTLQANTQEKAGGVLQVHGETAKVLNNGDFVTKIGEVSLELDSRQALAAAIQKAIAAAKPGQAIEMTVRRDGKPMQITITPIAAKRPIQKVVDIANASPAQLKLRQEWLFAGKKPLPK